MAAGTSTSRASADNADVPPVGVATNPASTSPLPQFEPGRTDEVARNPEVSEANDHWVLRIPKWMPAALAAFALLVILAIGAWYGLRRQKTAGYFAPTVEKPKVQPNAGRLVRAHPPATPGATEPPAPTFGTTEPDEPLQEQEETLSLAIEARQLSISLMAATLSYRITLTNSGKAPVRGIAIAGDMISAHSSRSTEEQMATSSSALAPCHDIADIPAGKSVQVMGEFRLPLPMIQPIRRGDLALFVPLARLRVEAAQGTEGAIVKTALIGQRSPRPGAGLQPFRLDLGPRVYREVTQKIFS